MMVLKNPNNLKSKSVNVEKQSGGGILKYFSSLVTDKSWTDFSRPLPYVNNDLQAISKVDHSSSGLSAPLETIKSETVTLGEVTPEVDASVLGSDTNQVWGGRQGYDSLISQ